MAEIHIFRPWYYMGCVRKLIVWIDGERVGSVMSRKSEVFTVSSEFHAVQVSMDWCKSVPLHVDLRSSPKVDIKVFVVPLLMTFVNTIFAPSKVFYLQSSSEVQNLSPYPRD